jgi:serine/threonine-protein kinase RsbW
MRTGQPARHSAPVNSPANPFRPTRFGQPGSANSIVAVHSPTVYLPSMIERSFPRRVDALGSIFEFVRDFFASQGLPTEQTFDVDLILEELFTNMVRHSRDGRHDIDVKLDWDGSNLTLVLRDFDVSPFDVSEAPRVDLSRPPQERTPGGLGLHLVHMLSDGVSYEYADRTSTITVTKRLEL